MNHTPGPWSVSGIFSPDDVVNQIRVCHGMKIVAEILFLQDITDPEVPQANANLISAAPDLLKALKLMQAKYGRLHDLLSGCIEDGDMAHNYDSIVQALVECNAADHAATQAIQKSKGESN